MSVYDGFKDPLIHFLHFEKNIYMNWNSTQITGIAFFRTKTRETETDKWKLGSNVVLLKFQ